MSTPPKAFPQLDLREVEALQAELLDLVEQLNRDPDRDRQTQIVRSINDCSERLRVVSEDLERKVREFAVDKRGTFDVQLTPDQAAEINRLTGVDRQILTITDDGGGLIASMPTMTREEIFALALSKAEADVTREKARNAARAQLDRIRDDLRDAPEQVRNELERLLADPEFRRGFDI